LGASNTLCHREVRSLGGAPQTKAVGLTLKTLTVHLEESGKEGWTRREERERKAQLSTKKGRKRKNE